MNWAFGIQVLSVLGGVVSAGGIVTALSLRKKVRAEAKKTGADTAEVLAGVGADLVTEVRADMRELKAEHRQEMREMQAEVRALRRHVGVLEGLLRTNGVTIPEFAWPP